MDRESKYFTLSLESLRAIGGWAADCAERALSVYETRAGSDTRPVRRLKASGSSPLAVSARLGCVRLPWRRMPPHVRSARLLQPLPLAPQERRRRAPTRIPWRM